MFPFYGSKGRVIKYYPSPKLSQIIEPFAGSARYALQWFDRDVLLVDSSPIVIRIWRWLQTASVRDVISLPKLEKGLDIKSLSVSEDEKYFLGMLAGVAQVAPRWTVSAYAAMQNCRKNQLPRIAGNLHKIRHWKIVLGNYRDIPNQEATWFIDPPYQIGGYVYRQTPLDYENLSKWCQSRLGQVLVCENTGSNWLPFRPLCKMHGVQKDTTEALWCNEFSQLSIFATTQPN
jgi:hypothetical protein